MKPHPALAVPLVNAGRRQRSLRNAWGKPNTLSSFINNILCVLVVSKTRKNKRYW